MPESSPFDCRQLRGAYGGTSSFPQSYCAYETKPTHGIVTVNCVYSTTFCDQNPLPVDEDHSSIAKPSSTESDIYIWARARILEANLLAEGQKLQYFLKKTPYNYRPGLSIEGVEWRENYREYEFIVRNPSKTERILDLRLSFAFPWPVIASRFISQEGCEGLEFAGNEDASFRVGSKNQIIKLQESWTNQLKIGATAMFPESAFHAKLIMIADWAPSDFANLQVDYRDGAGSQKRSFYHKITVLDAATGAVRIEPEPLKGKHETIIQFRLKEPIDFKGR